MSRPVEPITNLPQADLKAPGAALIGHLAGFSLRLAAETYPKPGLISRTDSRAYDELDAPLLEHSANILVPYFSELAVAGSRGVRLSRLRAIGLAAERAMFNATGGINTHRGAIYGLGLLCAAAGLVTVYGPAGRLGAIVKARWGPDILDGPITVTSPGAEAARRYGAGGAQAQAAAGFPAIYDHALPALRRGERLVHEDIEAPRVEAYMALVAALEDTTLLHRGGVQGLALAQRMAQQFLESGGVGAPDWREAAEAVHRALAVCGLSPDGSACLLAMTLFVRSLGE